MLNQVFVHMGRKSITVNGVTTTFSAFSEGLLPDGYEEDDVLDISWLNGEGIIRIKHAEAPTTFNDDAHHTAWVKPFLGEWMAINNPPVPVRSPSMEIRRERDTLLAMCDWTQLPDSALSDEEKLAWQTYRTALRNLPQQEGFPWDGEDEEIPWPEYPGRNEEVS